MLRGGEERKEGARSTVRNREISVDLFVSGSTRVENNLISPSHRFTRSRSVFSQKLIKQACNFSFFLFQGCDNGPVLPTRQEAEVS